MTTTETTATGSTPDLASYDWILVNSSGGKDSQAMLTHLVALATVAGVLDRLVVVHCDLGRVEWAGTRELAAAQAAHYGLRFEVVSRPQGDLLQQVEERGMWPSSTARYCTSDHKRGQVRVLMTELARQWRAQWAGGGWRRESDGSGRVPAARPCRILNCMGLRAQESPARAKKPAFAPDAGASNGRRTVDEWLPILGWTVEQVWSTIRASGVPYHRAYDLGMGRLSCCFCIYAPTAALMIAGEHNRALLADYVAVEQRIGHSFRMEGIPKAERTPGGPAQRPFRLAVIQERLEAGERAQADGNDNGCWGM